MQRPPRHLLPLIVTLWSVLTAIAPGYAAAQTKNDTSGKLTVYTRTSKAGDEQRKKDTVVLWSNAEIQPGEELDTVVVAWGKVNVYGKVKDLVVVGGEVTLHDNAVVDGSLVVLGGKLQKREGAKVAEQVQFELPTHLPKWIAALGPVMAFVYSDGAAFLYVIVRAVFLCLFGALLYVIAPDLMQKSETMAWKKPLPSLMWAFIGAFLFIPGVVILAISIIGIMFIPLFVTLYGFIYYFAAFVMAANILGHNLPPRDSIVMPPLRFFYGVFIFVLLSYIPFVGPALIYLAMAFTSGAMFHTIFTKFRVRLKA